MKIVLDDRTKRYLPLDLAEDPMPDIPIGWRVSEGEPELLEAKGFRRMEPLELAEECSDLITYGLF